jgi:hypothetical protein
MIIRFPSPTDLAYIAGFFDGEGSVQINLPEGTSQYLLRCAISNTDRDPLVYIKDFFGGTVLGPFQRDEHHQPIYQWKADSVKAEVFLRAIAPFLQIKKERACVGLEFRELFQGEFVLPRGGEQSHPDNHRKRKAILELRHEYYLRMKALNQRGVHQ